MTHMGHEVSTRDINRNTERKDKIMKLTHHCTRAQVTRTIDIENGPVIPMPYSVAGKMFRVERLSIRYDLEPDGWRKSRYGTNVSGTVLKKDGTDSKSEHSSEFLSSVPHWISDIAEAFKPQGQLTLPEVDKMDNPAPLPYTLR